MKVNTKTELLINGSEGFEYLIDKIQEATSSVVIQMFIWRDDELGRLIANEILKAANRGVKVHISKDLLGGVFEFAEENRQSFFYEKLPPKMRIMELFLVWGYPMKGRPKKIVERNSSELAKRFANHENITLDINRLQNDHSKYIIIDKKIIIISGMNFEYKEWKYDLLKRPYHDFMIGFEDPRIVQQFKNSKEIGTDIIVDIHKEIDHVIDFVFNTYVNGKKLFNIREGLINRIMQAEYSIDIIMAYLGDGEINKALVDVSKTGVKIKLYVPLLANLQNDLNHFHLKQLMKKCDNMTVYLCKDMIHGKLLLIDNKYVTFGSANLNKNAMDMLMETNVGFYLDKLNHRDKLMSAFDNIMKKSHKVEVFSKIKYNKIRAFMEYILTLTANKN